MDRVGVKNSDRPCDLRLRPSWPPVKSVRIAFLEGPSGGPLQPSGEDEIRVRRTQVCANRLRVLFAIEITSRRVHALGITRNPDSTWVTPQARNLAVGERLRRIVFLIRDRDAKFSGPFDEVFRSEGVKVIETPIRSTACERVR